MPVMESDVRQRFSILLALCLAMPALSACASHDNPEQEALIQSVQDQWLRDAECRRGGVRDGSPRYNACMQAGSAQTRDTSTGWFGW